MKERDPTIKETNDTHRKIEWKILCDQGGLDIPEECIRKLCLHSTNDPHIFTSSELILTDNQISETEKDAQTKKRRLEEFEKVLSILDVEDELIEQTVAYINDWGAVKLVSCIYKGTALTAIIRHYDKPQPVNVNFEAIVISAKSIIDQS